MERTVADGLDPMNRDMLLRGLREALETPAKVFATGSKVSWRRAK